MSHGQRMGRDADAAHCAAHKHLFANGKMLSAHCQSRTWKGGREEAVLGRNELGRLRKRVSGPVNPGQLLLHKRSLANSDLFCVRRPLVRPFSMFVVAIYQFVGLIDIGSGGRGRGRRSIARCSRPLRVVF